MLQLGPNLNLDRLVSRRCNDVYSPIAETRLFAPVNHNCLRKRTLQLLHHLILHLHVGHDDTAAGDILHLAQPDCFPAKFLDYRGRRLRRSSRWFQLRRVSDDGNDFVVRLCEGSAIRIQLLKIALPDAPLSKAIAELVHFRFGKRAHGLRTTTLLRPSVIWPSTIPSIARSTSDPTPLRNPHRPTTAERSPLWRC